MNGQPQLIEDDEPGMLLEEEPGMLLEDEDVELAKPVPECDCIVIGNVAKPKQHGADPHAKNCSIYGGAPSVPEPAAQSLEPASSALAEVLPADFPLPALLKFVPDVRLKQAVDEATRYALAVEVAGPEGLQRADVALTTLRASLKAIQDHFEDPADLANRVHKSITGKRAEWIEHGTAAVRVVGGRVANEQLRLKRIEEEERRKRQEEEDRKAREEARQRAKQAEQQKAPAAVVEEMKKQAETVTAPPVAAASVAPVLTGSTVTKTWKGRIKGTPAHAEPLPPSADYSPAQAEQIRALHLACAEGRAPLMFFELAESYINSRAKSEKGTFNVPGLEAFEEVGTRAKPNRKK